MITTIDGKKCLTIFQSFSIDYNLPKHKNRKFTNNIVTVSSASTGNFDVISAVNPSFTPPLNGIVIGEGISDDPDRLSLHEMLMYTNSFTSRIEIRLKYYFHKLKKRFEKKKSIEINYVALQDFFQRIPFQDIKQSVELVQYYENALLHVEKTGQIALKEKLKNILSLVRAEITLLDNDMKRVVTEENVVTLYEKVNAAQKLKLTWIKNFIKIIPTEVLKLKEKADALEIFDNYVILHFDPNNDATNLTAAETRAAKDPIMFGVIENSNKLYYIADWVDEYCNLTLESMFETLGDKVLEINNESVKSFIDNLK